VFGFAHITFTVAKSLRQSHRLRGLDPFPEVQPLLKRCDTGDKEFQGPQLWFDETGFVEVEVVDEHPPPNFEHPPPNFNPPLIEPDTPLLVQVREIFSEPFYLFSHPPTMLGPSVSSSVSESMSAYSSGSRRNPLKGIP
jgi:hypothetical protein